MHKLKLFVYEFGRWKASERVQSIDVYYSKRAVVHWNIEAAQHEEAVKVLYVAARIY